MEAMRMASTLRAEYIIVERAPRSSATSGRRIAGYRPARIPWGT